MTPEKTSVFALADPLSAKADPTLIGTDEDHFAAIAAGLEASVAELSARLTTTRLTRADHGQTALERDLEVHRLSARLRALSRFGVDLCLGRMVTASAGDPAAEGAVGGSVDGADADGPMYVGRLGLTDADGRRLLLDWRSPAAEPFFGATHGNPMGLASRRRYRWTRGRVTDYWDEVFTPKGLEGNAALDDQSAFIASLGGSRSTRMRDVLGTIQADQDAIIRAGSRGALVVDGGPGTGKTVVALHRTAYLLYADPRLGHRRGGVLFVGPHDAYLAYVADVLPSLGEEGVRTCTVADLVPEGASAPEEADPDVARLKARADLVGGIETAVAFYEETPPPMDIDTDWGQVHVSELDWAAAFDAPAPGTPHNEAREAIWGDLVSIVHERLGGGVEPERLDASLREDEALTSAVYRAWPTIEPTDLVGDLWSVPAYLRMCAPGLSREEIRTLQRAQPQAWTRSDLPYLDAARRRLGDPDASRRERRRRAVLAAEREEMTRVVDHLVSTDDSEMRVMSMLRGDDLRGALADEDALRADPDTLAGPFAHVVVDEAQELTDAQWQMLLARCPSRSFTIVGDRAQARHGFTETWAERLTRVGFDRVEIASLSINYRTPAEVMDEAAPVIRAVIPDANVPTSIRRSGVPIGHGSTDDLDDIVAAWVREHAEGVACVIGDPTYEPMARVRSLSAPLAKGLEFDLVVLVDPDSFGGAGAGVEGAVDRYVAMTRATRQLVVLTSR